MALTGIEIFKLLPKTNCKKCGFPTCLAFAMKVAQGQAKIEQCPDLSEEVKLKLLEASTPPIRGIEFGSLSNRFKIGEETVLFRHEKKFFNPTVLACEIDDSDPNFDVKLEEILNSSIERVGQVLRIEGVFLKNTSGDRGILCQAMEKILSSSDHVALILASQDPDCVDHALEKIGEHRPIIYGANSQNINEFSRIAKKYNTPMVVSGRGIDEVLQLVEIAKIME